MASQASTNQFQNYSYSHVGPEDADRTHVPNNFITQEKAITVLYSLHTTLAGLMAIASATVLAYSFDNCNRLLNGLFIVLAIESSWSFLLGTLHLVTKTFAPSSRPYAFGVYIVKFTIAVVFTIVAYTHERNCDRTIVMIARIIGPLMLVMVLFLHSVHEYGFSRSIRR